MWKLFLERMMSVVADGGVLSVVLPSGILTNAGATALRKAMLGMRIISMYEFENRKKIFPEVHRSYKFVLLILAKDLPRKAFNAAFYLHDISFLEEKTKHEKLLSIPVSLIATTSPESMAIPEFRTSEDVAILASVYGRHGRVRDGLDNGRYTIEFVNELHKTNDSEMFRRDGVGWPLVEGKNFHQYVYNYTDSEFTVKKEEGLKKVEGIRAYKNMSKKIHEVCRLAHRDIARATDMRTMISCIIPKQCFFANNCHIAIILKDNTPIINEEYYKKILYLNGIFNSHIFDYIMRLQVNTALSRFILAKTAIPNCTTNKTASKIIKLVEKLAINSDKFIDASQALNVRPSENTILQKVEIVAELNALVAHQYGVTHKEYKYILTTFNSKPYKLDLEMNSWTGRQLHAFQSSVREKSFKYYEKIANASDET